MKQIDGKEIINYINKKKANNPCHACGGKSFSTVNNELSVPVHQEGNIKIPGPFILAIGLVCENCGLLRVHIKQILEK